MVPHYAANSGHLEVVKLLVQSHANLNVKDNVSIESLQHNVPHT